MAHDGVDSLLDVAQHLGGRGSSATAGGNSPACARATWTAKVAPRFSRWLRRNRGRAIRSCSSGNQNQNQNQKFTGMYRSVPDTTTVFYTISQIGCVGPIGACQIRHFERSPVGATSIGVAVTLSINIPSYLVVRARLCLAEATPALLLHYV